MEIRKYLGYLNNIYKDNIYYYKNSNKLNLRKKDYNKLRAYNKNYRSDNCFLFHNHKIQFSSPFWFLHSLDEIFVQEVYKFSSENQEPFIIDCGSNIGLSILYFKELFKNSKIIGFEADPNVFKQLAYNVSEYGYNDVELINAAVWDEETKIIFKSEGSVGGKINFEQSKDSNNVEVLTIRLRDYLTNEVDFLKIDIEGAEYKVLKDCTDLISNVKNLFIEYHVLPNEEQHLHDILLWVNAAGFKYYIKEAWENMTYPYLKSYNDYYQMQLNIFCYK